MHFFDYQLIHEMQESMDVVVVELLNDLYEQKLEVV
jgi:hypothetical protein